MSDSMHLPWGLKNHFQLCDTFHCIRVPCRKNAYGQLKSCMYTISSTVKYTHTTGKTCTYMIYIWTLP